MNARVAGLRKQGDGIAVTVDSPSVVRQPLFSLATHAKVDLLHVPMEQLPLVMKLLKAAGGRRLLVAEKVETREPVSYTPLTLPTNKAAVILVAAAVIKTKTYDLSS